MKMRKFADKKKELFAIIIVGVIVALVSAFVIYLVHNLSVRVYEVFDQSSDEENAFVHFDFKAFEALKSGGTSAVSTIPTTTTASTTASSS